MTQIVSVTPELVTAMNQAQKFDAALSERRVNDANSYNDTVEVLNRLTSAVLTASASTPLLTAEITGPRFDVACEGLRHRLWAVIKYLREDASELVRNPLNLSRFERNETDRALGHIRYLYSRLVSAIEDQVVQDIRTSRNKSAAHLTELAKVVSTFVRRPQSAEDQTADEGAHPVSEQLVRNAARLGMSPAKAINDGYLDAAGNLLRAMPPGSHDHECGPAC